MRDDVEDRLRTIDAIFRRDGLKGEVLELSYELSRLRTNASILEGVLDALDQRERVEALTALKPYTKLAFYAASPSTTAFLMKKKDWLSYLDKLTALVDKARPAMISPLLHLLAKNLHERKQTGEALAVARRCVARDDASLDAFVTATALANAAEDFAASVEMGGRGRARAAELPRDQRRSRLGEYDLGERIDAQLLFAAEKLAAMDDAQAERARAIVAELTSSSAVGTDPLLAMNVLHSLIVDARFGEAERFARSYEANGGELVPDLLTNLVYLFMNSGLGARYFEIALEKTAERLPYASDEKLVGNVLWALNDRGEGERAVALLDHYDAVGGVATPLIDDRRLCALVIAKETERAVVFADLAMQRRDRYHDRPTVFHNAACAYAQAGHRDRAIEAVRALASMRYQGIAKLRDDADLASLREDPEFVSLTSTL